MLAQHGNFCVACAMLKRPMAAMRKIRLLLASSSVGASFLIAASAGAQTTTSGAVVTPTSQTAPTRKINGNVVQPRNQNLTPLGVNYSDCINNMELDFPLEISGFNGSQQLAVWAGTGDCTADGTRGYAGAIPSCWNLGQCRSFMTGNTGVTCTVRVQNLVGAENAPPNPATTPVNFGPEACKVQGSFAPVPLNIWFLPTTSINQLNGTGYQYAIPTDLVGPPPPTVSTPGIGDTLLLVNWTANTDSDTAGYDVFIDPPPGKTPTFFPTLFCNDGGATTSTTSTATTTVSTSTSSSSIGDGAIDDGAIDDGAIDDGVASASSTTSTSTAASTTSVSSNGAASCFYVAGNGEAGVACQSAALSGNASSIDSGSTTVNVTDQDGDIIDSSVVAGGGGITSILCDYLVGTSCPAGQPAYTAQNASVSGQSGTHLNITNLTDMALYNVVVAAVDNSGNVGPASPVVCQEPLPVDGFFKVYRMDNGGAGGNFCSLDAVGGPAASSFASAGALALTAFAFGRRRRRKGR
jgi:hypothetical protein